MYVCALPIESGGGASKNGTFLMLWALAAKAASQRGPTRSETHATTLTPRSEPSAAMLLARKSYDDSIQEWCPGRCPATTADLLGYAGLNWTATYDRQHKPRCDLCSRRWLFVASIGGRSGSTTILDMLNAHPAIALAGENQGALMHAMALWDSVADNGPWYNGADAFSRGALHPDDVLCDLQALFANIATPAKQAATTAIHGFKEVGFGWKPPGMNETHGTHHLRNYAASLAFLNALFPCNRILVSDRRTKSSAPLTPEAMNAVMRAEWKPYLARGAAWRSRWLDLEDFSADNFTRILQWMGEPSPAAGGCAYTDVLAANSGGGLQNAEPGHSVLDAKACKLT